MIMNMLTGANAQIVPFITALHACPTSDHEENSSRIAIKLISLFEFDTQDWVKDMINEMVIDYLTTLPEQLLCGIANDLADHPSLPLSVCLYLMERSDTMAEILLEHAITLGEQDLIYRLSIYNLRELHAVARRKSLNERVIHLLVKSGEPSVYLALLRNPAIQSSPEKIQYTIEMARRSPTAAWYMVNQPVQSNQRIFA